MKKILFLLLALVAISFTSCIVSSYGPGPAGYSGRAYYSISYDYSAPYSYWDNNPSMPQNPYFDQFYPTGTGLFDFEYFVNRVDYWYGTYEIWINPGQPGRPNGQPGRNGFDTYLTLICNADGSYEYRKAAAEEGTSIETTTLSDGSMQYTIKNAEGGMKITMKKASVSDRKSQTPKFVRK